MTLDELELALTKLRDAATPEGQAADRAALRQLLDQVSPEEATRIRPRLLALSRGSDQAYARNRAGEEEILGDEALLRRALREHLHEVAAPVRQFLRETVQTVRSKDWLEQEWDNYCYDLHLQREWQVIVPFECLLLASDGTVPVAAGRRIVGLPAAPEQEPRPGAGFLPYWQYNKRFLMLCAEIGGRFFEEGGRTLIVEVLRRVQRLSAGDRTALLLRCAALGLTTDDPLPLAHRLLQYADHDEFGARGGWIIDCVDNASLLPPTRSQDLLRAASALARRTTALVASNPFAACLEAISEVDSVGRWPALVELLERAAYIRRFGWSGWQRALRTGASTLQRLVAKEGPAALEQALEHLGRLTQRWPAAEAEMLLAGARGLWERKDPAAAEVAARAVRTAAGLPRWEDRSPLLTALGQLQASLGESAGVALIHQVIQQATAASLSQRLRTSTGFLLAQAVAALAEIGLEDGEGLERALSLARTMAGSQPRWIALNACAEALLRRGDGGAGEVLAELRRTGRRVIRRKPPWSILLPVVDRLSEAGPPLANGMLPEALRMGRQAVQGRLLGRPFAEAFMGLARFATDVEQVAALIDVAWEHRHSWWALALLALAGDALQRVEGSLLEQIWQGESPSLLPAGG